jgi:hypothetical protein
MPYAKIEQNCIVNVIVADADFASEQGLIEFPDYLNGKSVGIGWRYDGVDFIEPVMINAPVDVAPTKEQLILELQTLTAKINALSEPVSLLDKVSSLLGVK